MAGFPGYVAPGITAATAFAIDAGSLSIGGITIAEVLGPSRGGFSWDPGMTIREVPYDGQSSPTIGIHRITKWDAHLKGKVLLANGVALLKYSPGSSSDGSTPTNVLTQKAARVLFTSGDYLSNVYLNINRSTGKALRIKMLSALVMKWSVALPDNNEGEWDIDLVAVNAAATPNICPFTIEEEV